MMPQVPSLYKMIASYFILVIPFLFAGGALSLIFMGHGKRIFALYFADLCASAVAAILFSLLLRPLGGANFAWLAPRRRGRHSCSWRARPACTAVSRSSFRLPWSCASLLREPPSSRTVPNGTRSRSRCRDPVFDAKLEASAWTTIAKIDVFSSRSRDLVTGGCLGRPCEFKLVGQDNDAHTLIYSPKYLDLFARLARDGRPTEVPALSYFMRPGVKDVLVIGVGGGVDVTEARSFGAEHRRRGDQRGHDRFRDQPVPRLCEMALLAEHPDLQRGGPPLHPEHEQKVRRCRDAGSGHVRRPELGAYVLSENTCIPSRRSRTTSTG